MTTIKASSSPASRSSSSKESTAHSGDDEWEHLVDDDDDDMSSDHLDDDDDDEAPLDNESLLETLRAAWKQHLVAILVAVLATAIYAYQIAGNPAATAAMTTDLLLFDRRHTHLQHYQRTANITFCHPSVTDNAMMTMTMIPSTNQLAQFDFTIPERLLPALILHYAADQEHDDDYSRVVMLDVEDLASEASSWEHHLEMACIKQQMGYHSDNDDTTTTVSTSIQGFARYHESRPVELLYPETAAASTGLAFLKKPKLQPAHLTFTGFAAKFFNLSPDPVLLLWEARGGSGDNTLVGEIAPMESLGTATTPGQAFYMAPVHDASHALQRWTVTADTCLIYYDPHSEDYESLYGNDDSSAAELYYMYQMQMLNKEYAKHYLMHARRPWLSQFPRPLPQYFMWPATHFGQVQTVESSDDNDDHNKLRLTTKSVQPRVFTIMNFLSANECDELVQLALTNEMSQSTVYSGSLVRNHKRDLSTRSSSNTWLERATTDLTNRIYERAAKVLQIDESLLQAPMGDDYDASRHSIAESLQVVRYKENESYDAHHDFVYPPLRHRMQPTRFATLLMYLNDDFEGGETRFPRATNANFHDGITITPRKGMAVLFYNMLPDGNVDDLSQHSGQPVTKGEKYLANLWVWEPVIN